MAEIRPCSLARVAREAGVAKSTASLALRGSPRVEEATRVRVKAAAERLGYRADSRLGSLMARIRGAKALQDQEALAFVWVGATRADRSRDRFSVRSFAGAKRRAEELGCVLEEFFLSDPGMTTARLEKILVARGITGVVFSAPHHLMEVRVDWNWAHFAAARIGSSDFHPPLHRVESNHYRNMWTAMGKLREAGCRRPAVVLFELLHRRLHGMHQAAFVTSHPTITESLGMCMPVFPDSKTEVKTWLETTKADALVFVMNPSDEMLRWLRAVPQLKRMVTLDTPKRGLPGIHMADQLIGASAVDLVMAQLHRNERGVPKHPTSVLLEGEWRE